MCARLNVHECVQTCTDQVMPPQINVTAMRARAHCFLEAYLAQKILVRLLREETTAFPLPTHVQKREMYARGGTLATA